MAINCAPRIVTDGLVLCLDAANPKSYPGTGTTWFDLSKDSNHGTFVGGTEFNSTAQAMAFNGVNSYVNVPIADFFSSYDDSVTYEVWSYTPSNADWHNFTGGGTNIVSRGTYAGYNGLGRLSTNNVVAAYYRGDSSGTASASGTIVRDAWFHLVSIWTGTQAQLYINGNLANTSNSTLVGNPNSGVVSIGRQRALSGNNGGWYDGLLSNVKIYNTALTPDQVRQNFNATRGRYGI